MAVRGQARGQAGLHMHHSCQGRPGEAHSGSREAAENPSSREEDPCPWAQGTNSEFLLPLWAPSQGSPGTSDGRGIGMTLHFPRGARARVPGAGAKGGRAGTAGGRPSPHPSERWPRQLTAAPRPENGPGQGEPGPASQRVPGDRRCPPRRAATAGDRWTGAGGPPLIGGGTASGLLLLRRAPDPHGIRLRLVSETGRDHLLAWRPLPHPASRWPFS